MKKILLTAVLGIALAFGSHAQIALGVKAGLNFNQSSIGYAQSGASAQDLANQRTGFHFGVFGTINIGPIGIQPEAFYSAQGGKIDEQSVKGEIKTGYLQVPILVRFNFLKLLNIHAGPQFGMLLNETLKGDLDDAVDQALSNDISLVGGVGVDLPFGLAATIRYVKGLNKMFEVDPDWASADPGFSISSGKNDIVMVSVGYRFLGK